MYTVIAVLDNNTLYVINNETSMVRVIKNKSSSRTIRMYLVVAGRLDNEGMLAADSCIDFSNPVTKELNLKKEMDDFIEDLMLYGPDDDRDRLITAKY